MARKRGVGVRWVGLPGADHYLVRQWRTWHRLTADFVSAQISN